MTVNYTYNPPREPVGSNRNELRIVVDYRTGETTIYYNGVAYRPDQVSHNLMLRWLESTDWVINWTIYDLDGTRRDFTTWYGQCVSGDCP